MSVPSSVDPLLSLSFSVYSTKGAYALLLGSGISSAAGVPTGWQVLLDLIKRLAAIQRADPGTDPAAWYRATYGQEPDYSRLIEALAPTGPERLQLLRRYFEPTEEEREEGSKTPTAAHRAIAQLVADGYIRVIVTTNFDRLLETALQDVGIAPAVVRAAEDVLGMIPLAHAPITIIKLHGDYLDTRLRNTPTELESYEEPLVRLLDRVADEYGLIICGWSGVWDSALRSSLAATTPRLFTTYWATNRPLEPLGQELADQRAAHVIPIADADAFFTTIVENVTSLDELNRPLPPSRDVAVATLKRYLPVAESRIRMHDLVMGEVEQLRSFILADLPSPATHPGDDGAVFTSAIHKLEEASERILHLMATGGYWGEPIHRALWLTVLDRLGNIDRDHTGTTYTWWKNIERYPAQLSFYAAGIGALAADKEDTLADLLLKPLIRKYDEREQLVLALYGNMNRDAMQMLWKPSKRHTPISDRIHKVVREPLRALIPDDETYEMLFNKFEILAALAYFFLNGRWVPLGRFGWRSGRRGNNPVVSQVEKEIDQQGSDWILKRYGMYQAPGAPMYNPSNPITTQQAFVDIKSLIPFEW